MNQTCLHMILILGVGITSQTIRANNCSETECKVGLFLVLKNVG